MVTFRNSEASRSQTTDISMELSSFEGSFVMITVLGPSKCLDLTTQYAAEHGYGAMP
jgi:hypothetical protein